MSKDGLIIDRESRFGVLLLRFFGESRGAAAAEFAIVIFVLLIIVVGAIEGGRLVHAYQITDKGVRDAARYLAQQDIVCATEGANQGTMAAADVRVAEHLILTGLVEGSAISGGTLNDAIGSSESITGYWTDANGDIRIEVDCLDKNDPNVTGGFQGAFRDQDFIPLVRVEADVPFAAMIDLFEMEGFSVDHRQVGIGIPYTAGGGGT